MPYHHCKATTTIPSRATTVRRHHRRRRSSSSSSSIGMMARMNNNNLSTRRRPSSVSAAIIIIITIMSLIIAAPRTADAEKSAGRSSFLSRRRMGRNNNEKKKKDGDAGGLTLGELDVMMQKQKDQGTMLLGPSNAIIFGSTDSSMQNGIGQRQQQQGQRQQSQHQQAANGEAEQQQHEDSQPVARKRSLGRINLDLSGRILCHIFSPGRRSGGGGDARIINDNGRESSISIPLFSLPTTSSSPSSEIITRGSSSRQERDLAEKDDGIPNLNNKNKAVSQRRRRFAPQRFVPHVYLGADYDLDEVWYGATRWIAKCSWGPSSSSSSSSADDDESNAGASSLEEVVPTTTTATTIPAWKAMADTVCRRLFPSSSNLLSASSWMLDAEGERSVFDGGDTTARLRLIQSTPSSSILPSASVMSTSNANDGGQTRLLQTPLLQITTTPAQLSIEYDSAKYYEETTAPYHATTSTSTTTTAKSNNGSRALLLQYAPAITMGIKIPFLHPRIEVHSKKTFVVKGGGDANGNYYGGDYFGGGESSSSADRRLESIKERYRNGVPTRSTTCSVPSDSGIMDAAIVASSATGSTSSEKSGGGDNNDDFVKRLSTWLENDGWMPRRATADLMGNLISTSEVGFFGSGDDDDDDDDGARTRNTNGGDGGGKQQQRLGKRQRPLAFRNAGVRLRISKRIDWTAMGIFPWSKAASTNSQNQHGNGNDDGTMLEALRSTHLRLELCGLYGEGGGCASVGVHVDPLDWGRTMKVVVVQEGVGVLG